MRAQTFQTRQTMHNSTFEVFHYHDAQPARVELHHHDFYEVYFFQSDTAEYRVEGKTYRLQYKDLLLINPQELHQPVVEAGRDYERIVLWIDRAYLDSFSGEGMDLARCFDPALPTHTNLLRAAPSGKRAIEAHLMKLAAEAYGDAYGSRVYAQALFLQFMVELNRLAMQQAQKVMPQHPGGELPSRALSYIGAHYAEELSLGLIAERLFVSKYHLSHAFSRSVGTSVYRYITLKRLQMAKQMLQEGQAPGAVSRSCGFADYASFYRAFRAEYGAGPREYCKRLTP